MRPTLIALIFAVPVVLGQTFGPTVRYSSPVSALAGPASGAPQDVAYRYLASAAIAPEDLPSVYLAKQFKSEHNGVTHLVYRQRFQGIEVHNAAWVANIGPDGAILNTGGSLYPAPGAIDFGSQVSAATAVQAAVREVNPRLASTYVPFAISVPAAAGARAVADT